MAAHSGLVSAWGGKLTTHRAMGEKIVEAALRLLPASRRRDVGPSRTWDVPLHEEAFERVPLEDELELMSRGPLVEPTAASDFLGEPGEEDLEQLLELVVDALRAYGLGETFFEWQGEVALDRRLPGGEIVLSGTAAKAAAGGKGKNGRLVIEASLRPGRGGGGDRGGEDDG